MNRKMGRNENKMEDINQQRISMDLESLKPVIDEFQIDENSGLWDYLYETFIKEKEARSFVKYLKMNKLDLNNITKEECEQYFLYLCGAFDRENPESESEN